MDKTIYDRKNEGVTYAVDIIRHSVLKVLGVPEAYLYNKCRKREHVQARQSMSWFMRKYSGLTLREIANQMIARDHATIIASATHWQEMIDTERDRAKIHKEIDDYIRFGVGTIIEQVPFGGEIRTRFEKNKDAAKYLSKAPFSLHRKIIA